MTMIDPKIMTPAKENYALWQLGAIMMDFLAHDRMDGLEGTVKLLSVDRPHLHQINGIWLNIAPPGSSSGCRAILDASQSGWVDALNEVISKLPDHAVKNIENVDWTHFHHVDDKTGKKVCIVGWSCF